MMNQNLAVFIASFMLFMVNAVQAQSVTHRSQYMHETSSEFLEYAGLKAVGRLKTLKFDIDKLIGDGNGVFLPYTNGLICLNKSSLDSLSNDIDGKMLFKLVSEGYF
nr:hypothetical protein [uncultured Vibrio sp.]